MAAPDSIFIIWPDVRYVSAEQIQTWYFDAVANGEIAVEYLDLDDPERQAEALSDAGIITLGRA